MQKNAFKISSFRFWDNINAKLNNILRNSNYPNGLILKVIRNVRNELGQKCVTSDLGTTEFDAMNVYQEMRGYMDRPKTIDRLTIRHCELPKRSRKYVDVLYHPTIRKKLTSILKNIRIVPKILKSNRFQIHTQHKRDQ